MIYLYILIFIYSIIGGIISFELYDQLYDLNLKLLLVLFLCGPTAWLLLIILTSMVLISCCFELIDYLILKIRDWVYD